MSRQPDRDRTGTQTTRSLIIHLASALISSAGSIFSFLTIHIATAQDILSSLIARFLYVPVYTALWLYSIYSAVVAWRGLYSPRHDQPKWKILANVVASVFAFVFAFATVYYDLSQNPRHFETEKPFSVITSLYFSIVTFATVGYGDIAPKSDTARFWVMLEIIGGLAYTILFFSVIASFIARPVQPVVAPDPLNPVTG